MKTLILLIVASVACAGMASAAKYSPVPRFMRGRPTGGMLNYGLRDTVASRKTKGEGALPAGVQEMWVTQKIDNFNPQDTSTYQERFFVNDQFWNKETGPIFVMLGGEAAQDPTWAVECDMVHNAQVLQGLVILTEHRFYGKSQPFTDLSTEHLQYLSSEQALADYANLIDHVRELYNATDSNPVVAFGGSYSGALAAWLRLKYPSHVVGSVATSSPVFAELDFTQYYEVVAASLSNPIVGGSDTCVSTIETAMDSVTKMLSTPTGLTALGKLFNTCGDLSTGSKLDITNFMSNIIGLFAGVVQYNQDNRAFEGATHTNITIDVVCETLQSGSDPLTQWGVLNTMLTDGQCTAFNYSEMIMAMRDTSLTAPAAEGGRQWTYQTCAEFGFYQTTDGEKQPFGSYLPLDFSIQQCEDIFGTMFDQSFIQDRVDFTLAHYGGRDLLGTNIIIPAGAIDPWHALEVLTPNPAYNITTILIDDGAHCSNMYPHRPSDSAAVLAARKQILTTLTEWVAPSK